MRPHSEDQYARQSKGWWQRYLEWSWKGKKKTAAAQPKPLIRLTLLLLLWVWAALMFVVVDLFLNVEEFDRVRPRSVFYQTMRSTAHELVGEPDMADTDTLAALETSSEACQRFSLNVQVETEDGAPVEAASVAIRRLDDGEYMEIALGGTDDEGGYSCATTAGTHEIRVSHHAHGAARRRVILPASDVILVLRDAGTGIKGRVVEARTGRAVSAAAVTVRDRGFECSILTGPDGTYQLTPLVATAHPGEGYTVTVRAPGKAVAITSHLTLRPGVVRTLDWLLVDGTDVQGSVLDTNGAAIPDATVACDGAESALRSTTDPSGRYVLRGLLPRALPTIVASAPGFVQAGIVLDEDTTRCDFRLERACTVTGHVLRPDGSAAVNARVFVHPIGSSPSQLGSPATARERGVDGRGAFRFDGVPFGSTTLVAFEPDGGFAEAEPFTLAPGDDATCTLTLRPGLSIRGDVVDDRGRPVVGADVQFVRRLSRPPGDSVRFADAHVTRVGRFVRTDTDGAFVAQGLIPDLYRVVAESASSGVAAGVEVDGTVADNVVVRIRIGEPGLAGRVTYADGRPAAFSYVRAGGPLHVEESGKAHTGVERSVFHTQADAHGRFCFAGVPEGEFNIAGRLGVLTAVPLERVRSHGGPILLTLREQLYLRGRVTREETGEPIVRFRLQVRPSRPESGQPWEGRTWFDDTVVSADGTFEVLVTPGAYTVAVETPLRVTAVVPDIRVDRDGPALNVLLRTGGSIQGKLLDSEGKPMVDHWIAAWPPRGPSSDGRAYPRWAKTNQQGEYHLRGLPAGKNALRPLGMPQSRAEWTVSVAEGDTTILDLRLPVPGRLQLIASDSGGRPAAGIRFNLYDPDGNWVGWTDPTNEGGSTLTPPIRCGETVVAGHRDGVALERMSVDVQSGQTLVVRVVMPEVSGDSNRGERSTK